MGRLFHDRVHLPTYLPAPSARRKGSGWERPVRGERNGPRTHEDPVGPCHGVAGGPVGYKRGMRDGMGARG